MQIINLKEYEYNDWIFTTNFKNKINLLVDDSGTGKTFLIKALKFFCKDNDIKYTHIDYEHKDLKWGDNEVVLFDKADLYFTDEFLQQLREVDVFVVISIKNITKLNLIGDFGLYRLINTGDTITTKKWR